MNKELFQFTVADTFLIEGRGLIIAPFFPVNEFQFDRSERIRIEKPDGSLSETVAEFDIPMVSPIPKIFNAVCLVREARKEDVPIGSRIILLDKTHEQVLSSNL